MGVISNAANIPIQDRAGTLPDVSGALQDYFQPMLFVPVIKTAIGYQVNETLNPINFRGVTQPFKARQLEILAIGQQAWTWLALHSDTSLTLQVDDIVLWKNMPTRVMDRKDFELFGYIEYVIVQDWNAAVTP